MAIIPLCTGKSFSPVPFMGRLRAYRFHSLTHSIVGPPPHIDWTLEWHEVLHTWNERAAHFVGIARIQSWSRICCGAYWKLGAHREFCIGNLWGLGGLGGQNTDGTASCRCIVATKDWVAGTTLRRSLRCGSNNGMVSYIFAANERATCV